MEKAILKSAALAYQKLLSIEYRIVLGRKGKQKVLDIAFLPDNFYMAHYDAENGGDF